MSRETTRSSVNTDAHIGASHWHWKSDPTSLSLSFPSNVDRRVCLQDIYENL